MTNAIQSDDGVVVLRGTPVALNSDIGRAWVTDACRNAEQLMTDAELQDKYGVTSTELEQFSQNKTLVRAIQDERARRIRNGVAAQESAALEFSKAPKILGTILGNKDASPRHRIEAAQALRAAARSGSDIMSPDASDRVSIVINIGAEERLVIDQPKKPIERWDEGETNG
jgi:hypothetical protein